MTVTIATNAVDFLNEKLRAHPQRFDTGGGGFHGGRNGLNSIVFLPYHVDTATIVSNSPILFDLDAKTSLPEQAIVVTKIIRNCADVVLQSAMGISITATKGWKATKTRTIAATNSVGASGGFNFVVKATVDVRWSETITTTNAEEASTTQTTTISINDTITVKPGTALRIEAMVTQVSIDVPFTINAIVDGELLPPSPNFDYPHTGAAHILTEAERTIPVTGLIRVTDVSAASINIQTLTGDLACPKAETNSSPQDYKIECIPFDAIPENRLRNFIVANSDKLRALLLNDEGPGIGMLDGLHCEPLYKTQVTRFAPECGLNDIGFPNPGTFEIEHQRCSTYVDGKIVFEENKDVETFLSCASVFSAA